MDVTTWVSIGLLVVLGLWMIRRTGTHTHSDNRRGERERPGPTGSNTGSAG
jgi:ABC-type nickel/cobalt efflux system permease component RcnA